MEQDFEILDAFVDGDRVDPDALKHALSAADGRDYFVDVLALRDGVRDGITDDVTLTAIEPSPIHATGRSSAVLKWLSAAAVIMVSVASGYEFGHQTRESSPAQFVAAPMAAERPTHLAAPVASVTAPTPTRVIRLEPGVDWNEHIGGN